MTEARKLVGLSIIGNAVHDATKREESSIVVAESVEALGMPLNHFCAGNYPNVPNQPGDDLIDVVIGDPWLLKGVKVVARWSKNSPEVPDDVRLALYPYEDDEEEEGTNEIILFETKDGSLVYVEAFFATLLESVIHRINPELLAEA